MRRLVLLTLVIAGLVAAIPAAAPARSASSDRIAFVRDGHIWTIAPDGSGARQLTSGSDEDGGPTWSPDRATIAFVRQPTAWGSTPRIFTVLAAGGEAQVLAYRDAVGHPAYRFITGLAYSPDGGQLAFADVYAFGSRYTQRIRLLVIDLASGETTVRIKRENGFGGAIDPGWSLSWSPDGTTLLVAQAAMDSEGGQTQAFDIAKRRLHKLGIADASCASWAPAGTSIVISTATQAKTRILLADPSGAVTRTLARGSSWNASARHPAFRGACFSVGGEQIAYTVDTGAATSSLWIMNADGTGKHRLTTGRSAAWR